MEWDEGALRRAAQVVLGDVGAFSKYVVGVELRPYQLEVARAILRSVNERWGLTFVVVMSRQAGKNETQAQLEAYLLNRYRSTPGAQIVKASPTFKPQTVNAMMRLRDRLNNDWLRGQVTGHQGYIIRLGQARALFFSAAPGTNVVGATANILLECDEAQDVDEEKWNKDFKPMAASTNATTVLWGTIWTSRTLLGKQIRVQERLEREDGRRRVFLVPWEMVAQYNPAYGDYVKGEIQRLGRHHPLIKTQYYLEEIDAESGMFPAYRQAQMRGSHPRRHTPEPGRHYVMAVDVAGETEEVIEGAELREREPRKDSTALTIAEVVERDGLWHYRVVERRVWTGTKHAVLYATLLDIARTWRVVKCVVDATGVGAGLASFLAAALGDVVVPFVFSAKSKSDLGWTFLGMCDSGRYKDYVDDGAEDTRLFWAQVEAAEYEILDGPAKRMRWGVVSASVHDDLLISAGLLAALEGEDVSVYAPGVIVPGQPLRWEGEW